ncbi:MAG: phosphoadenylyl-sulfate reductase [Rubrimonas sp.]|uniref:phosphoadenylyl-sulfate reductase n=1 Tax=Rubrimonas sp. TaxID=2036015 RepID=UPI002FDD26AC
MRHDPDLAAQAGRERLAARLHGLEGAALLRAALAAPEPVALVSSFGAESAALLHMVAEIDPATPVLFLETGMLFPETLAYQRDLAGMLGLRDLRLIRPEPRALAVGDPDGRLHARDHDACCALRKTEPLRAALRPFAGWITGRKRGQTTLRARLRPVEADAQGLVKLNPLADWDAGQLRAYMAAHDLPPHPLVAEGFPSIGCAPCTTPVAPGEHPRAGRWRGAGREECGIHIENGVVSRGAAAPLDAA